MRYLQRFKRWLRYRNRNWCTPVDEDDVFCFSPAIDPDQTKYSLRYTIAMHVIATPPKRRMKAIAAIIECEDAHLPGDCILCGLSDGGS